MRLLFCFLFLCTSVWAKTGKLVFSDQAVFKVEERVYLLSDVYKLGAAFQQFRCLVPDSLLFGNVGLDKANTPELPDFSVAGGVDLQEESLYLSRVLKLIKLEVFIGKQSLDIDKNSLKDIKTDGCGVLGSYDAWPKDLKELFRLEGFWNDRFSVDSMKLSDKDVEEIKLKNPKMKGAALSKLLDEEKLKRGRDSAQSFMKTVEKQLGHEIFY